MLLVQSLLDVPETAVCAVTDGHTFAVYEPGEDMPEIASAPAASNVPAEVTMRQARQALYIAGRLADVTAAIDSMPEPPRESARIAWEYSQVIERDATFVRQLATALGMSNADVDALFVAAAGL